MMRFYFLGALMLTTLGVAEKNAGLVETSRHKGRSHKVKSSWSQYGAAKSFVQVDAKARYIGKVMADAKFEGIDAGPRDNHLHLKEILDKYDDVNDYQAMDSRQTMAVKMSMDSPDYVDNPPPSQIHRGEYTGFSEFMLTSFDGTFDAIAGLREDLKSPDEGEEFSKIDGNGGSTDGFISEPEWKKALASMILIEADEVDGPADDDGEPTKKDCVAGEIPAKAGPGLWSAVEGTNQELYKCAGCSGTVSFEEWIGMNVVGMDRQSFDECDNLSRDGQLTLIELETCLLADRLGKLFWIKEMALDSFNDADRDNSKTLTSKEFRDAEDFTAGISSRDKEEIQEKREIDCTEFQMALSNRIIKKEAFGADFDQINGVDDIIDREEWLTFSSFLSFRGQKVFITVDDDGDGFLDTDEFETFWDDAEDPRVTLAFSKADQDGNGKLDYAEVMALMTTDLNSDKTHSDNGFSEFFWLKFCRIPAFGAICAANV